MLRAVSVIFSESRALELHFASIPRRHLFKLFRASAYSSSSHNSNQTVLTADGSRSTPLASIPPTPPLSPPPPPPPPRTPPVRRAWTAAAAALALTASLGGVYFYRKLSEDKDALKTSGNEEEAGKQLEDPTELAIPPSEGLPEHVHFLLVGAGTASFAAMRAIRSARPDAQVLIVGEELQLPYMRPPLSKELWREPQLPAPHGDLDGLTFRQWNGRRRPVTYEPSAFYTPVEELATRGGAVGVARGWRVVRIDVERHEAQLRSLGGHTATVRYDRCLVAPGVRPRRLQGLREVAAAGRALALRTVRDAAALAAALEQPHVRRVAIVGGGFLGSELSAALAERLRNTDREVVQIFREEAPLAAVLPSCLAADAARRLAEMGVRLRPESEVRTGSLEGGRVRLQLATGEALDVDLVVECVGCEVDEELARASRLEVHPELGGLVVNAELQARTDVFAAGDVACFYDAALGRRRVEHHDHAVVSGRLAGENMAAEKPARPYAHQSMFWSDLGPDLGYEAIGLVDSRLPTVSVFASDAVAEAAQAVAEAAQADAVAEAGGEPPQGQAQPQPQRAHERRFERGVVLYVRERRVVGVLLWNLFNRMSVARAVLQRGEFEDLFEVAKLFSLHEHEHD